MSNLIGGNWLILTPILILSVAAVGVIIERSLYFFRIRPVSEPLFTSSLDKIGKVSSESLLESFPRRSESPGVRLLHFALTTQVRRVPQIYKQRLEAMRDRQLDKMERNLPILNGIGNVATLMGLFGTVSGMIKAFSRMSETGNSDPYILAGGISQALVTTAAGLAVAIPAMLANHLFETVVDRHAEQMEEVINHSLSISGVQYARKRDTKKPQA